MGVASSKTRGRLRYHFSALVMAIVFVLVQAAAFNTGENLLYLLAGLSVSFLGVSLVVVRSTMRGLRVMREAPDAVHRDEPFTVTVHIENRKRFLPTFSVGVALGRDRSAPGAYVLMIPARTTAEVRIPYRMDRRGVHALPETVLTSGFPMGLFRRRITCVDELDVVVYPRAQRVSKTVLDKLDDSGSQPRVTDQSGDEYYALREYVPGDDLRYICWRISARVGQLIVRELEPSSARSIVLIVDTRGVPDTEDLEERFEDAVELAASLALSFLETQYAVALITPNRSTTMGQGAAHLLKILDALARVEPVRYGAYGDDWFRVSGDLGGSAKVYVATDPAQWGGDGLGGSVRILDPQEVLHAS